MIKLISTDFDGTLFAEFEDPPVPVALQKLIGDLQAQGAKWVINTGRDLSSLLEALGRSHLEIKPDYLVLVEREIYSHDGSRYTEDAVWNRECQRAHTELFRNVRKDVPRIRAWIEERFEVVFFEDDFSPFCLIASRREDADPIHEYLTAYCRTIPKLEVVRNDVSSRFCHEAYNKGTALAEVARQIGVTPDETFAVGDHLNDLSMLSRKFAHFLAAPSNAIDQVKELVLSQNGFVSEFNNGHGVADALRRLRAEG